MARATDHGGRPEPHRPPPRALDACALPGLVGYDQAALDAAGVPLVVVDARQEGHPVVWISPAFTVLTGYDARDLLGRNCNVLQTEDTCPDARARLRAAQAAGEPACETLLNRRADGTLFWNELLIAPVHSPDGDVTHYAGYQVDVTARVRAHAAHGRLLAADHAPDHAHAHDVLDLRPGAEVLPSAHP